MTNRLFDARCTFYLFYWDGWCGPERGLYGREVVVGYIHIERAPPVMD